MSSEEYHGSICYLLKEGHRLHIETHSLNWDSGALGGGSGVGRDGSKAV